MCRVAREKNKLLAVGHQRHYSVLYDNANYLVQNGLLGDIRHIRALWHRNNASPLVAKDKDGKPVYDPKTGLPDYVRDEKGNIVYLDSWKPTIPDDGQERRLRQVRLQEPRRADPLAALQPHRRRPDGRAGQPPARRLLDLPGQEAPAGRHRHRRHVLLHRRPRGRRPRLRHLRVPRQGRPKDKDHVVVTYSSINTNAFDELRRDGHGLARDDDRRGRRRRSCSTRRPATPATVAADEHHGREGAAGSRCSRPARARAGPTAAVGAGRPGDGRPLARLSRGARALRLLHPPRQRLELPRRQGAPAPLPRRGRPGRRRHRPDQQPRHAAEAADRVRPERGSTTPRPRSPRAPRPSPGGAEALPQRSANVTRAGLSGPALSYLPPGTPGRRPHRLIGFGHRV